MAVIVSGMFFADCVPPLVVNSYTALDNLQDIYTEVTKYEMWVEI